MHYARHLTYNFGVHVFSSIYSKGHNLSLPIFFPGQQFLRNRSALKLKDLHFEGANFNGKTLLLEADTFF